MTGPAGLTRRTAEKTDNPSDLRTGIVSAVTARGITVTVAGGSINAAHLDSYAPGVGDNVALMKTQDSWLAMGRIVGSGTPTDYTAPGSGIGPSILDAMKTSGTSTLASSTGATVAVPKYTVTFYHPPNHVVIILTAFTWGSNNNADWIIVDQTETVSGTAVGEFVEPAVSGSFGRSALMWATLGPGFGGKKRVVSTTMARLAGAGTAVVNQADIRPGFMIAWDMGDSSVFRTA